MATKILRSHILLLLHKLLLNNDHLSTTDTIFGVPRVVVVHRFGCIFLLEIFETANFKSLHLQTNKNSAKRCLTHKFKSSEFPSSRPRYVDRIRANIAMNVSTRHVKKCQSIRDLKIKVLGLIL